MSTGWPLFGHGQAERLFLEAQREDPECLPAFFALYKFYFNTVQFEKAEDTARRALAEAARQGGFTADWTQLGRSVLRESASRAGDDPAHFFCFTLMALAFITLRQGYTADAKAILAKLDELDPEDTVGGSVIRTLAHRVEDDDD